jgi:putative thioredoxin
MFLNNNDNSSSQDNSPGAFIYDVSINDFEEKVIMASLDQPVMVDFWAPWCAPCKQLTPVLEEAIKEHAGKIKLAKINIDQNQELAQALQIQSIPAVFVFFQGQPVDGFAGVKSSAELKSYIDQILKQIQSLAPEAQNNEELLKQAHEAMNVKDYALAQSIFMQVLSAEETNFQAYAGLVRLLIEVKQFDKAQVFLDDAPEQIKASNEFNSLEKALELAQLSSGQSSDILLSKVSADQDNHELRFDLALSLYSEGAKEEAINHLIEIVRRDKDWNDQKARKQLLEFFDAMGPTATETVEGRKKLSTVLFS